MGEFSEGGYALLGRGQCFSEFVVCCVSAQIQEDALATFSLFGIGCLFAIEVPLYDYEE